MTLAESLRRIDDQRVGYLASVTPEGHPHLVPVVFTVVKSRIVTPIDWKPKTGKTLQRLVNLGANPSVAFLVDHYEERWDGLWWERVDGTATVHIEGADREAGIRALEAKYNQYRERAIEGAVILIDVIRISSWAGREPLPTP